MQHINNFSQIYIDGFKLCIAMLKNEYNFNLIGILKKNDKIIEYCETISIPSYSKALEIYNKIKDNKVFPSHFYYVIDDN